MSEKRGKKRPKSYYIKCANKKTKTHISSLTSGMKGFLVTCNSNEKAAVKETYNILNEYADKLYGPEPSKSVQKTEGDEEDEEDLEKAIQKEVQEIKDVTPKERRFQNVSTKAKNCIFIKTLLPDPNSLAHAILADFKETKVQKSRYAIRLLPILGTCSAKEFDILKLAHEILPPVFETPYGQGYSFSIIPKIRNNNSIGRDSLIPGVANIIKELNPLHTVNHSTPDFVILLEIIQTVCCFGIVKDFFTFRKYNLHEIVKSEDGKLPTGNKLVQEEEIGQKGLDNIGQFSSELTTENDSNSDSGTDKKDDKEISEPE